MRVLGRLRLSTSADESTSVERQRETIQHGPIREATRSSAGPRMSTYRVYRPVRRSTARVWLGWRAPESDIICAWKLDRLGRNAIQLNKLSGWCGEHGKTLVSCSESIHLSSWAGRMLAGVIAGLAEGS
ncbi:recombinase family protein [Mycobacterium interjectum]|nr:recombinase family protein [Mycobacterium interjectum]